MNNPDLDSYIECALWSSIDIIDGEEINLDEAEAELSSEAIEKMREDLNDFIDEIEDIETGLSDCQVAHDFWLTRNGHGTGFWDRGLGEVGDKLTQIAKMHGSCDLYIGDDNQIHLA